VTYTALAVVLLITCAVAGAFGGVALARPRVAAIAAAAMVAVQFVVLAGR
jgi:hypothetical protein